MNTLFKINCVLMLLVWGAQVFAQDLGPIGPKTGNSTSKSKSSTSSTTNVSLPYKPQVEREAIQSKKTRSDPVSESGESEVEKVVVKEIKSGELDPKYPAPTGAPDLGI